SRTAFEVLVLGCSSPTPSSERNPSGQLVNNAQRYLLVDCREATQIQLRRFRARRQRIGRVFNSHIHGHHDFGLRGLLSSMNLLGRQQDLHVYCPAPLRQVMEMINNLGDTRLSYTIHWHETKNDGMHQIFADEKVEVFSF